MSPMVSRSIRKESVMILLLSLAEVWRALELAIPMDSTSLESTEFQPVSQLYFPRFAWSSDCASMRSRGGTAVLELLATPARAIIIAADPGRRARCRGLPGGAAQQKINVREIFGLVRFYTDDY